MLPNLQLAVQFLRRKSNFARQKYHYLADPRQDRVLEVEVALHAD